MKRYINRILVVLAIALLPQMRAIASSHREAPLISNDPTADNTDLYAFRSPCNPDHVVLIANFIPFEHPAGGPNWYGFGQNVNYEIHIKNDPSNNHDDITYRFVFVVTNNDPSTFFDIRLGHENNRVTYDVYKSRNGGEFHRIYTNGQVPPPNIGPRSLYGAAGLGISNYDSLMMADIATMQTGERVFCGPIDDPFFVDLGGAFDVGGFRNPGRDGLAKFNCHTIAIEIPIDSLQKDHMMPSQAANILDPNFVIGVWASASRPRFAIFDTTGMAGGPAEFGQYVQVSRLGMPLTNEVIIPIGMKDKWNASNPYTQDLQYASYFENPELALYMDDSQFGTAVPGLHNLRIQTNSLGAYDFRNGHSGLYALKGSPAVAGTALDDAQYGTILLPDNHSPRAVDILPIFYSGVPNERPYQLATGKNGNPLAAGKPFINNFLPVLGDMLRLNMAVPPTSRTDAHFSNEGIIAAAVAGLTDTTYTNHPYDIQFIPNMDGFPNGRRLEDDVTRIELQAVSGIALAAIGLWYDDYVAGQSPVTPKLDSVLTFSAGVDHNDTTFKTCFPYVQDPWPGFTGYSIVNPPPTSVSPVAGVQTIAMVAYPNPFASQVAFNYKVSITGSVTIHIMDVSGRVVEVINEGNRTAGNYTAKWNSSAVATGTYLATMTVNGQNIQTIKIVKTN
jgi:hypothetical protein